MHNYFRWRMAYGIRNINTHGPVAHLLNKHGPYVKVHDPDLFGDVEQHIMHTNPEFANAIIAILNKHIEPYEKHGFFSPKRMHDIVETTNDINLLPMPAYQNEEYEVHDRPSWTGRGEDSRHAFAHPHETFEGPVDFPGALDEAMPRIVSQAIASKIINRLQQGLHSGSPEHSFAGTGLDHYKDLGHSDKDALDYFRRDLEHHIHDKHMNHLTQNSPGDILEHYSSKEDNPHKNLLNDIILEHANWARNNERK